jgi:hypothetical protein
MENDVDSPEVGTPWVVVASGDSRWPYRFTCERCGVFQDPPRLPMELVAFIAVMDTFSAAHAECQELPECQELAAQRAE